MRILLTRPEADARLSAEKLSALGHSCIVAPLFEIAATGEHQPHGDFSGVLATSAHAFDAPEHIQTLRDLPMHLVGERTAEAARHAGFAQLRMSAQDATHLAQHIGMGAEHFLYLAGRERRPELETLLTAQGHRVTPWIVYETREATHLPQAASTALMGGEIDAVLHFSTRSAALYRTLAQAAGLEAQALKPVQIAISSRAAQELVGARQIAVAPTPDFDGFLSAFKAL